MRKHNSHIAEYGMTSEFEQTMNESSSGYCKMPDGTLIQYGSTGAYTSGNRADYTITFPIPFKAADAYLGFANGRYFSDANSYEVTCTTNNSTQQEMRVHVRNPVANFTNVINWIAIGRWK